MKRLFGMLVAVIMLGGLPAICGPVDKLDGCNVVWEAASEGPAGSMPLGNGDVALNVWVEEGGDVLSGDLLFYISKADAWDAYCRLIKLGRIRVKLDPNPFVPGQRFRQELRLRQGEIAITAGEGGSAISVVVWVDANRPVVHVEAVSQSPFVMQAGFETWRTSDRPLDADYASGTDGMSENEPPIGYADTVLDGQKDRVVWFHRNTASIYPATLKHQDLGPLAGAFEDPLLNRTFGGLLEGEGFGLKDRQTLVSAPATRHAFEVHVLTTLKETAEEWRAKIEQGAAAADKVSIETAREEHEAWWSAFWDRSWIYASGPVSEKALKGASVQAATAGDVTRGYALQRFVNACAGRGAYPIKFNGSLFCVDAREKDKTFDADYRRWAGAYWFQNTRLPYWSMLYAGDLDLMDALFKTFSDARPLAEARTGIYFNHDGAFYPETMYFWGTYVNGGYGYGWDRTGLPAGRAANEYIGRYWSGGIEWIALLLDRFDISQDADFLGRYLPTVDSILTFYDQHWKRGADGKILFDNCQSLETWWNAVNPTPEIAGLHFVLPRLLKLPKGTVSDEQRARWKKLLADLPDVPVRKKDGKQVVLPALEFSKKQNSENPELYAVFPYRLYGVGKPHLKIGIETWKRRLHPGPGGWNQDPIQAALLGLGQTAADMTAKNFLTWDTGSRFPGFWGPNYDWIPDQDHGCVAMTALQRMLMQCEGKRILLLPAWPVDWDVEFKLHAPFQTTVAGEVRGGKLLRLNVLPETRRGDVEILLR
jgi:alpha-L-fucosidase 2